MGSSTSKRQGYRGLDRLRAYHRQKATRQRSHSHSRSRSVEIDMGVCRSRLFRVGDNETAVVDSRRANTDEIKHTGAGDGPVPPNTDQTADRVRTSNSAKLDTSTKSWSVQTANSSFKRSESEQEDDDLPSLEQLSHQRRRLSVSPLHVGPLDTKDTERRKSSVKMHENGVRIADDESCTETTEESVLASNCAVTRKGFVPYNKNKRNQDTYIVKCPLVRANEAVPKTYRQCYTGPIHFWAVSDGHGEFGHHVAKYIHDTLPALVHQNKHVRIDPTIALTQAIEKCAEMIRRGPINTAFSGSTIVCALSHGSDIWVANVGDSRAILATHVTDELSCRVIDLSNDQKPCDPGEYDRIVASGGRVAPLPGPPDQDCGPMRVWMRELDVPGLAMSRSIGDDVAANVGVIATPVVRHFNIDELNGYFLVLATDGVFEFLSSQEVADIVAANLFNLEEAASKLVHKSVQCWQTEEEVIDDITAVISVFRRPSRRRRSKPV